MKRLLLLPFLALFPAAVVLAGAPFHDVNSSHWTDEFDVYFAKYSKRYFGPHFDWRWFKSQSIAESGLKINAKSWVGAKGLMQIMPATYAEIRRANPHFRNITEPRWNIAAGIFYNRYLYREWEGIPNEERLLMAFGSYNAGLGGILRAKRRSKVSPVVSWKQVEPFAPAETRGYVARIRALKKGDPSLDNTPRLRGIAAAYQQ